MATENDRDALLQVAEQLLDKLSADKDGEDEAVEFTKAQKKVLIRFAKIILATKELGRVAGGVGRFLQWIAVFVVLIVSFRSGVLEWLANALNLPEHWRNP